MDKLQLTPRIPAATEFPPELHGRILQKILNTRVNRSYWVLILLLAANFSLVSWHLWMHAAEADAFAILKFTLGEFEMSSSYFQDSFTTLTDLLPLDVLLTIVVNAGALLYAGYMLTQSRKLLTTKGRTV